VKRCRPAGKNTLDAPVCDLDRLMLETRGKNGHRKHTYFVTQEIQPAIIALLD